MRKLLTLLLLSLAALVAACGGGDDPTVEPGDDASADAADRNDADVVFAQGMIPHHEQAIDMAGMVLERGSNADVKSLAEDIMAAQVPEIEILRGWLQEWDESETPEHGGHATGDSGEMTMMTDEEMKQLEGASGADLDTMFLEMMIRHHEGAISMARTEVEDGRFPDAKELAQKIIDTQQAEITTMKDLLAMLGG